RPGRPSTGQPSTGRPSTGRRRRPPRPRWARRVATGFSVVVLAAAGIGHALVTSLDTGIARVDPFKDMKNRPGAGGGMNLLLVGTDGRDKISEQERKEYRLGGAPCHCTDTIMIVHLSADRRRASVVSLPRDSYAVAPAHTDQNSRERHQAHPIKLNSAYAEGGPNLTVRTVERMTRLKIDHYLEVDFTSFMKTVDAVGGVEICNAEPMKDSHTGLDLAAGTHQLSGGQALQYVRSRYVDGASDLGRMQRQQRFMAALIAKATSSGVLLNPVKFRKVSKTVLGSVRADKRFGTDEMLDLGRAMRGFSPASSEFTTVPIGTMGHQVKGVGSTLKWHPKKSAKLFRTLREDRPLAPLKVKTKVVPVEVSPRQIRVQVDNGTKTPGLAKRVDSALRATGFQTTKAPGNAERRDVRRTVVAYDPRWDRSAKSLATALPGSELQAVKGQGAVLRVIAGADFEKVTRVRAKNANRGEFGASTGDQVVCG
ncbi:LCP family protein, partial [Streptomyces sp. E11-3]|uniref:LCP family protein n=1 Tax=Streptomyces sp. E11-3 TaxID=3110112 RepID=UPI00397FB7C4